MKVLIVKTSSMGDVLHTLPAVTDAYNNIPNITIDWAVEPSFSEIPSWHKAVNNVIKVPIRWWRKNFFTSFSKVKKDFSNTVKKLRAEKYDKIIDAQGLLKSVVVTKLAYGKSFGLGWSSIKEPLASLFYDVKIPVAKNKHAVTRVRELFAKSLSYEFNKDIVDYGLDVNKIINKEDEIITNLKTPYVIFFHGTTWKTKHWPEEYWIELSNLFAKNNVNVYVTWSTLQQKEFVNKLHSKCENVFVLPTLELFQVAKLIASAKGVIGVDTGFCHLSAALNAPTIALYGPTSHIKTGTMGNNQVHLFSKLTCAPCFSKKCTFDCSNIPDKFCSKESASNYVFPACFSEITPKIVFETFKNQT